MRSADEILGSISKLVWERGFEPRISLNRNRRFPPVLQDCLTLVPGLSAGVQCILKCFTDDAVVGFRLAIRSSPSLGIPCNAILSKSMLKVYTSKAVRGI